MSEDREHIARIAESLDFDPKDVALFEAVVRHLEEKKDYKTIERAHRAMLRKVSGTGDVELEKKLWTRLGRVYQHRLDDIESAIVAFEMPVKLAPDHGAYLDVAYAYEKAGRRSDARGSFQAAARANPFDVDAYNRLFEIDRESGDVDGALRAAQSLMLLKAPVEEATEMVIHRLPSRLPELRPLTRDAWKDLWPYEDHLISNILRFPIAPASKHAPPVRPELLHWAARMLGSGGEPDDGTGLRAGADLESVKDGRLLREEIFHAGREATALVWSHYHFVRSPANEIAAHLFGAIRVARPNVPIPPEHAGAFAVAAAMETYLSAQDRPRLAKVVDLFFENGASVDLRAWQLGIRLTRLRAGLLLAGSIAGLGEALREENDELPSDTKRRQAFSFNVSEAHRTLRGKIGWELARARVEKAEVQKAELPADPPDPAITWVTAHPEGRWIAVGEISGRVLVWSPSENRIVAQRKLPSRVLRVEWTSGGEHLVAIADGDDRLYVSSPDGASEVRTIATGHGDVRALAVHPSKPWAATAGVDSHLRVWDLTTGKTIFEKKTLKPGSACALSETLVAVGSKIGEFDVWETLTTNAKAGGEVFTGTYVSAMAFDPSGTSLVMGGGNGKLVRFDIADNWKLAHAWNGLPPKPIATNDIRYRDDKTWVAAHSDDRASLFLRPADMTPQDLGQAFWLDRKPWDREYIVSSACFVPGTKVIVTAHFSGRLRIWSERVAGIWMRVGDVIFDPKTGAAQTFGPIGDLFAKMAPAPEPKKTGLVVGDKEHRARTMEEMTFAASLHPCVTCGGRDARLVVSGSGDTKTMRGVCHFCGTPKELTVWVEGEPAKRRSWPNELGEEEPSAVIEPRAFTAELERLEEIGIDDANRLRVLTCVFELLKFPLIRDGERGDALRAKRDRLRGDLKEDARPPGPPPATIASIVNALVVADSPPTTVGELEYALGVRIELDADALRLGAFGGIATSFSGPVTKLAFEYLWDKFHEEPVKTVDELRTRALTRFGVTLTSGTTELDRAFRDRFGAPRVTPTHRVFAEKWLVAANAARGPEITVSWYAKLPDGALPPVDRAVRERAIADLAKALASAAEIGGVEQAVRALPEGCGVRLAKAYDRSISIELAPPMAAPDFVRSVGWDADAIVAETRDMHGATFYLFRKEADAVGFPRVGRWTVRAFLKGWPKGGELPYGPPIGGRHRVGPEDLLHYVVFEAS